MSINCWGRRYPNAPLEYYTGAQRRLPPHWWMPNLGGFTGDAAHLNGFRLIPPASQFLSKQHNPDLNWILNQGAVHPQFEVDVSITVIAGVFHFQLKVTAVNMGGGGGDFLKQWSLQSATGWDWGTVDFYNLPFEVQSPNWTFGGDALQAVFLGFYSLIPPDSCSGVFP